MADIPKLRIQVTKTADGQREYVQIMSADQFTVNVVLIANEIELIDERPESIGEWPGGKAPENTGTPEGVECACGEVGPHDCQGGVRQKSPERADAKPASGASSGDGCPSCGGSMRNAGSLKHCPSCTANELGA